MSDETFAYLCPKCKTVNTKDNKYCIKCGHWLLDSNFPATSLNRKEFKEINNTTKPESKIKSIVVYSIIGIIFLIPSINVKMMISLIAVLYGIINIIYPIKMLSIYKRSTGVIITIISFIVMCVVTSYQVPSENKKSTVTNTNTYTITNTIANTITNTNNSIQVPETLKPTPEPTKAPELILNEFKSECINIDYNELARDTESYIKTKIKITGKVVQIQELNNIIMLRVNITKGDYGIYKDTVLVNYLMKDNEKHILDDDLINIWGTVVGRKTYKAVLGNSITIPEINARSIALNIK